MKRCPYCAEEIQDAAIKCRWCGSMLIEPPNGGETAAAPAPSSSSPISTEEHVEDEALQYTHSGQRFLLGYGTDFFGIWDRQQPGPPVSRFPRTDDGWRSAWLAFSSSEPHSTEVGIAGAGAGSGSVGPIASGSTVAAAAAAPGRAMPRSNGMALASMVLGIIGLLFGILSVGAIVLGYMSKGQIDRSGGTQGGRGQAVTGIVLGWIGAALWVIEIILVLTGHSYFSINFNR